MAILENLISQLNELEFEVEISYDAKEDETQILIIHAEDKSRYLKVICDGYRQSRCRRGFDEKSFLGSLRNNQGWKNMTNHTNECNCPDCTEVRGLDTSFGHIFEAPCHNVLETDGIACDGVLIFGANSVDAACDKCGARCGRHVAFHTSHAWEEARKPNFGPWYCLHSPGGKTELERRSGDKIERCLSREPCRCHSSSQGLKEPCVHWLGLHYAVLNCVSSGDQWVTPEIKFTFCPKCGEKLV